ncbi:MAG: dephospho-CoA kinase [Opitutales bacterium]|nr:dephospho-CoA kinase [Opitutales bacterium]
MKKNLLIALTGSIGAGKSAAGRIFAELGMRVLDADKLAKKVLFEDLQAQAQIREALGDCCFEGGQPDAKKIADAVFADEKKLAALEKIIHPRVEKLWRQGSAGAEVCVVEIPLLFEKNLEKNFDICLTVFCSEGVRVQRLLQRGMSLVEIERRTGAQMPQSEKVARSQTAFFNDGSVDFLREQIELFLARL